MLFGTPRRRRQRCLVAVVQGIALSLGSAAARAEEPSILWSAPMECPSHSAFRERVATALGAPLSRFETEVVFDVRVEHQPDGYHAVLWTQRQDDLGGRVITDRSCDRVTSTLAFMLANALRTVAKQLPEPGAAGSTADGSTDGVANTVDGSAPARDETGSRARVVDISTREAIRELQQMQTPEARSRYSVFTWHATLLGGGDAGALPGPTPAVSAGIGLWTRRFSTTLRGQLLASNGTSTAQFSLVAADVDACYRPLASTHAFVGACAILELGDLSGKGTQASWAQRDFLWFAPGLRLTGGFRLGRSLAWLVGGIGGLVPTSRPSFTWSDDEATPVHQPSAVVGRVDAGVLVEFR